MTDPASTQGVNWLLEEDHPALDVAAVAHQIIISVQPVSVSTVNILCFYSLGWHSLWQDERLFGAEVYAGSTGPLIPQLMDSATGRLDTAAIFSTDLSQLEKHHTETIDAVLNSYGTLSQQELRSIVMLERPYYLARRRTAPGNRAEHISYRRIQSWFAALLHPAAHTLAQQRLSTLETLAQKVVCLDEDRRHSRLPQEHSLAAEIEQIITRRLGPEILETARHRTNERHSDDRPA